jgi:hypothetical protein
MQDVLSERSLDPGGQLRHLLEELGTLLDGNDVDEAIPQPARREARQVSRVSPGSNGSPADTTRGVAADLPPAKSRKWITPANTLALMGVLTTPGMVSLYQSHSAARRVNDALMIVGTGVEEFKPGAAWTASESIRDWRESKKRVRFLPPVPCNQPDVRVSLSSVDLGGATRLDIAAPDDERTKDGFLLVVRTWGGALEIPWVKIDWFAACRGSGIRHSAEPTEVP